MYEPNVQKILAQIKEEDIVLDIGGWFQPFNRANWVIDVMPYETRRRTETKDTKEYFSKETWIQRDVCDRRPLPFKDKEIDFVICSHILEDIRDPIYLCSEICRVAKQGYIEVPSRVVELSLGAESRHYAGYSHHRWIVEANGDKLTFLAKPHFIHKHWKCHLPSSCARRLVPKELIQFIFWKEFFQFEEKIIIDYEGFLRHEIEEFVKSQHKYSNSRYKIDEIIESCKNVGRKIFQK